MLAVTFAIMMIIAASLGVLVKIAERIEDDNRLLELSLESADMYSAALEERGRKIRRLRHDTLGLLQAIESAAPGDETSGRYAGNMPLLDAVLSLKEKQCRESKIDFEISVDKIGETEFRESDLCLLVQNLLDNAYEANLRIEQGAERKMSMEIRNGLSEGVLSVRVSNRTAKGEGVSFLTNKPNPELHGIGTKVIDEIVKKYNGHKTVEHDPNEPSVAITAELFSKKPVRA